MTFEEWIEPWLIALQRDTPLLRMVAEEAWKAAGEVGEGKQLVGAHGSLMDKLSNSEGAD